MGIKPLSSSTVPIVSPRYGLSARQPAEETRQSRETAAVPLENTETNEEGSQRLTLFEHIDIMA